MKILYIAPFDHTGYGTASTNYLKAMDAVGLDVVPRRLKFNDSPSPDIYTKLAAKSVSGCDVLIQHTLPHQYVYDANYFNVGMFASESDKILPLWVESLNLMDLVVVFNEFSRDACERSGVYKPVVVWPHAFDMAELENAKLAEKIVMPPLIQNDFKFLYCGEFNARKNLPDLIRAFHLAFDNDEPVSLIIKTTKGDYPTEAACYDALQKMVDEVKAGLGKYPDKNLYKKEIVAVEDLPRDRLLQLYNTADCFVSASYGEAWGIPGFECAAMGKEVICTEYAAPYVKFGARMPHLILMDQTEEVPVMGSQYQHGTWYKPNPFTLMRRMQRAFRLNHEKSYTELKYDFSHKAVGGLIAQTLNEHFPANIALTEEAV